MNKLSNLFYSKIRAELFRLLFGLRCERVYLNELVRITGFASRSLEEELTKLKKLKLIISSPERGRIYYAANRANPLFEDLRHIVLKTVGLHDPLERALSRDGVEFAFVAGSLAELADNPSMEVRLVIIAQSYAGTLEKEVEAIGRAISPSVVSMLKLHPPLGEPGDKSFQDICDGPKLFVAGKEPEFIARLRESLDTQKSQSQGERS
jgi:hypothetical protein